MFYALTIDTYTGIFKKRLDNLYEVVEHTRRNNFFNKKSGSVNPSKYLLT